MTTVTPNPYLRSDRPPPVPTPGSTGSTRGTASASGTTTTRPTPTTACCWCRTTTAWPGRGFGPHPHRDMEIVTWVLAGEVLHDDSKGNHGVIRRGLAQRMSAGTGLRHSEMNPSPDTAVHFVQMWVPPDTEGIAPGYEQRDLSRPSCSRGAASCPLRRRRRP